MNTQRKIKDMNRQIKKAMKSILTNLIKQLNEGAITNQNMICTGYIPLVRYDCGLITHFAIIDNCKNLIPNSVTELSYEGYEFVGYDKDHKIVFDVHLDTMAEKEQIPEEMWRNFDTAFEKYYDTYVYESEDEE